MPSKANAKVEIPDKPTLSVQEFRKIVPMGEDQTYRALASGEIPAVRIGRSWRVLTEPLRRMLGVV